MLWRSQSNDGLKDAEGRENRSLDGKGNPGPGQSLGRGDLENGPRCRKRRKDPRSRRTELEQCRPWGRRRYSSISGVSEDQGPVHHTHTCVPRPMATNFSDPLGWGSSEASEGKPTLDKSQGERESACVALACDRSRCKSDTSWPILCATVAAGKRTSTSALKCMLTGTGS